MTGEAEVQIPHVAPRVDDVRSRWKLQAENPAPVNVSATALFRADGNQSRRLVLDARQRILHARTRSRKATA
jgi:hypothetical protein